MCRAVTLKGAPCNYRAKVTLVQALLDPENCTKAAFYCGKHLNTKMAREVTVCQLDVQMYDEYSGELRPALMCLWFLRHG